MPKGKFLVIDASVIISAAYPVDLLLNVLLAPDDPVPRLCQEVFETILDTRYRVVVTPEIQAEWDAHLQLPRKQRERAQHYLYGWLAAMGQRGLVYTEKVPQRAALRHRIEIANIDENIRAILQKDLLLIEAALATDRIIISRDDKARHHYSDLAYKVEELRVIVWVNPCQPEEQCIAWLKNGANPDEERRLGFLKP